MTARWRVFGRWPSQHDLDLVLDADEGTYAAIEKLANPSPLQADLDSTLLPGEGWNKRDCYDLPVSELPIPAALLEQAAAAANGIPLDLFLSPMPGSLSVGMWLESPYQVGWFGWRGTCDKHFFDGHRPIETLQLALDREEMPA